jgi:hypothetical protein
MRSTLHLESQPSKASVLRLSPLPYPRTADIGVPPRWRSVADNHPCALRWPASIPTWPNSPSSSPPPLLGVSFSQICRVRVPVSLLHLLIDSWSHSLFDLSVVLICALQPLTAMDYYPDTCEDLSFHGLAVGCPEVCREHGLPPRKCVAFEGPNKGRIFYMCSVENVSRMVLWIFLHFSCRWRFKLIVAVDVLVWTSYVALNYFRWMYFLTCRSGHRCIVSFLGCLLQEN